MSQNQQSPSPDPAVQELWETVYGAPAGRTAAPLGANTQIMTSGGSSVALNPLYELGSTAVYNLNHPRYTADPLGVADSSTGIQAWVNDVIAAKGTGVSAGKYKFSSTISMADASGQMLANFDAIGGYSVAQFVWAGANSIPCFSALGWNRSWVRGMQINIPATSTGVIAWEIDVDGTHTSCSHVIWERCFVNFVNGATSCVGWRIGHAGGATGGTAVSNLTWIDSDLAANNNASSHVGWVNEHANGLVYSWFGGGASNCNTAFTNTSTAGAASSTGGDALYFYGLSNSVNLTDFSFGRVGHYGIYGGRFETGQKFLTIANSSACYVVEVDGVEITTYAPSDNIVFNILGICCLILDGVRAVGSTYTAAFITFNNGATRWSALHARGCAVQMTADPFYTVSGTTLVDVWVQGCMILNGSAQSTQFALNRLGSTTATRSLTYGATVNTDASTAAYFVIPVTNGTAFTIANPTNPYPDKEITYEVFNNSGGAIGAITMGAALLLAGGAAFVGPGNGKRRIIAFRYNATAAAWVELYRTAADT